MVPPSGKLTKTVKVFAVYSTYPLFQVQHYCMHHACVDVYKGLPLTSVRILFTPTVKVCTSLVHWKFTPLEGEKVDMQLNAAIVIWWRLDMAWGGLFWHMLMTVLVSLDRPSIFYDVWCALLLWYLRLQVYNLQVGAFDPGTLHSISVIFSIKAN